MKQTHRRGTLGNVSAVVANSPSVAEAARRLNVDASTVFRWIRSGAVPRPGSAKPTDVPAETTVAPLALDAVLEGRRPADPASDVLWLALRREVFAALTGGPFDPRHLLALPANRRAAWLAERREYVARLFRDDARFLCD